MNRRRLGLVIAAVAVVVAVGVVAIVVRSGGGSSSSATSTSSSPSSPSSTSGAASGVKPVLAGLLTRNGPPAARLQPAVSNWVVNVNWSDLQRAPGAPIAPNNPIDRAIATAQAQSTPGRPSRIKVRLFAGIHAPAWAKSLGGAPVPVRDPQSGQSGTIGRFWTSAFSRAYAQLQQELAAEYDDVATVAEITAAQCTTVFSEPFIRDASDQATVRALLAAGFTADRDAECMQQQFAAHEVWRRTRTSVAFNVYQHLQANGSWSPDLAFSEQMMHACRATLGSRCVLENNSVRWPLQQPALYQALAGVGPPLAFQTATSARVGDLQKTISYCISIGASAVELPAGATLPVSQLQDLDRRLRVNGARVDASS